MYSFLLFIMYVFPRKMCIPKTLHNGRYTLIDCYTPTSCLEYKSWLYTSDLMPLTLFSHSSQYGFILCSFFLLFVLVHPYFTVFFYLRTEDSEFPLALFLNHTPSSTDLMSAFFPCEVFRSAPCECCLT